MRLPLALALAAAVGLSASAVTSFRHDLSTARQRVLAGSQVVQTSHGAVEYASVGEGPPVLALHGAGGGWDQGVEASRGLIERGYRVIAPSRFGYLGTPLPADSSAEAEADTWAALLDVLQLDRVPVLAFSAGTAPAMQLALRHPDRVSSLVLMVPAGGGIWPEPAKGPPGTLISAIYRDAVMWPVMQVAPSVIHRLVGMPPELVESLPPDQRADVDAMLATLMPFSARRRGVLNEGRTHGVGIVYPIEQLRMPVLLISAPDDLYQTLRVAKRAAERIPDAQLLEFENGGHLLAGHGDKVWPAVMEFLEAPVPTCSLD